MSGISTAKTGNGTIHNHVVKCQLDPTTTQEPSRHAVMLVQSSVYLGDARVG